MKMGFAVHIVSGDRTRSGRADRTAPRYRRRGSPGVRPAGKVAFLEELRANGHRVLMIGDGINDVAALAAAHASLAPISAADISQAQSDAVFLGDSLAPVCPDAPYVRGGRRAAMRQNLCACRRLQRRRRAGRDGGLRHAADRRRGHVRLVDPGDAERAAVAANAAVPINLSRRRRCGRLSVQP